MSSMPLAQCYYYQRPLLLFSYQRKSPLALGSIDSLTVKCSLITWFLPEKKTTARLCIWKNNSAWGSWLIVLYIIYVPLKSALEVDGPRVFSWWQQVLILHVKVAFNAVSNYHWHLLLILFQAVSSRWLQSSQWQNQQHAEYLGQKVIFSHPIQPPTVVKHIEDTKKLLLWPSIARRIAF